MDSKPVGATTELYRKVFSSPEGKAVFTDIMNELNFFATDMETQEEVVLNNFAKKMMDKLGIWREHNAFRITDALLNMSYREEIKSEER